MKALLLTVAGLSSRFEKSLGRPCLKCIYYEQSFAESLLYRMLCQKADFDRIILVGGYRFDELQATVARHFPGLSDRIALVKNEHYADLGTGYSLYLGLQAAIAHNTEEIVFAEGDLWVDSDSFGRVCRSSLDVVTSNTEPILAEKSVAFYYDSMGRIHYIYDAMHQALRIDEPFTSIFNSGQVWKFSHAGRVKQICRTMRPADWQGTNLVFIQKYFQGLLPDEYENIRFRRWINCNTIEDFRYSIKGEPA